MTTKADFLQTVRSSLADLDGSARPALPDPPQVWPIQGLATERLAEIFTESLTAAAGECVPCSSPEEAAEKIAALFHETGSRRVALINQPLCEETAAKIEQVEFIRPPQDAQAVDPKAVAEYDAALLAPEYLLADSGSALFAAPTAFERLAVYLPPLCVVVARTAMLREHLPHAWAEFLPRWKSARNGEFVIVTGPSRTADIEKILVLGVHGPKRLVVFLLDEPE